MSARRFPELLFANWLEEDDEEPCVIACEKAADAIEYDGPTRVATYKLVEVNELSKRVVSKESK